MNVINVNAKTVYDVTAPGQHRHQHSGDVRRCPEHALSPQEDTAMRHLVGGLRTPDIATAMEISRHTAKFHLANAYAKLGASNAAHAAALYVTRTGQLARASDAEIEAAIGRALDAELGAS